MYGIWEVPDHEQASICTKIKKSAQNKSPQTIKIIISEIGFNVIILLLV